MQEFLTNNVFPASGAEPTNMFQRNVGRNTQNIRVVTSKEDKLKYCKLNPTAPSIRGSTAPVANSQNASAFKLAKLLSDTPHQQMSLSTIPCNINNTKHQIQDLQEIPIDNNLRFASFAINNMNTNIPTKPLHQKVNTNRVDCTTANEILNLFPFHWQISYTSPFNGFLTSSVYPQVTEQNHLIISRTGYCW